MLDLARLLLASRTAGFGSKEKAGRSLTSWILTPRSKLTGGRKLREQVQLLRTSGFFDEAWYLQQYADVKEAEFDPVEHYLRFGADENRDPSPMFSTRAYCSDYPDVAEAKINPLVHYITHGIKESRIIRSTREFSQHD